MSRPRLAVITPYFPFKSEPHRGHSAYQTLRRMGHWADIRVFGSISTYPRWRVFHPRSFRYSKPAVYEPPSDIDARYFEFPVLPVVSRPLNGWVIRRILEPAVREFAPDLILNYWLYPEGWAALRIARRLGVPAVLTSIGSDLRLIPDPITSHLTRQTLRGASAVITVSQDLRKRAIEMGASPDRSYTVLNGCDTGLFFPRSRVTARETLGIAQDAEIVLYVGNLNHTKGLRELLRACVALSSRRPRLELTVIGEGALRAELNSGPPVRLLGRRSSEEVAMWMAAADVFCLPSYSEGCPNVVLEALACGRPVVASDVGGIPELVNEQNGILVPPRNWERLADALEQALAGSWDEAGIAERAGRSWEDTARDTIRILEKVVK